MFSLRVKAVASAADSAVRCSFPVRMVSSQLNTPVYDHLWQLKIRGTYILVKDTQFRVSIKMHTFTGKKNGSNHSNKSEYIIYWSNVKPSDVEVENRFILSINYIMIPKQQQNEP